MQCNHHKFLHQHLYSKGVIHNSSILNGGTGVLPRILNNILSSYNADLRTNVKVASINIKNNSYESVTTEEGETIMSDQILSGLDPHNTFINLVGAQNLDPNFHTQINPQDATNLIAFLRMAFAVKPKNQ